jgi:hypothetical protein
MLSSFSKNSTVRPAGKIDLDDLDERSKYERGKLERPTSVYDELFDENGAPLRSSRGSSRQQNPQRRSETMDDERQMGNHRRADDDDDDNEDNERSSHRNTDRRNTNDSDSLQLPSSKIKSSKSFAVAKATTRKSFDDDESNGKSRMVVTGLGASVGDGSAMPSAVVSRSKSTKGKKPTLADLKKTSYKTIGGDSSAFLVQSAKASGGLVAGRRREVDEEDDELGGENRFVDDSFTLVAGRDGEKIIKNRGSTAVGNYHKNQQQQQQMASESLMMKRLDVDDDSRALAAGKKQNSTERNRMFADRGGDRDRERDRDEVAFQQQQRVDRDRDEKKETRTVEVREERAREYFGGKKNNVKILLDEPVPPAPRLQRSKTFVDSFFF